MFKQTFAVTGMNISSLPQRLLSSLVTVIGVACVVAVMVSLLAIGAGLLQSATSGASPNRAIVLSSGAAGAWLLFNGHAANIASLSFPLAVTPGLVVLGIVWSLFIGLIGGFLPSIRAARLPVATALRAT